MHKGTPVHTITSISIDATLSKLVVHADLRAAKNAQVTTVIADLCHAENIQDRVVGTPWFKEAIGTATMVGADYKVPNRNNISGCLLKDNAAAYKSSNFDDVTKRRPQV